MAHWLSVAATKLRVVFMLAAFLYPLDARADPTDCTSDKGAIAYAQCLHSVLIGLEKQLDQAFQKALENLPNRSDEQDARRTNERLRQHLTQAQAAWKMYAIESCLFSGAMQGRGVWMAATATQCQIMQTKARIDALQRLPGPP